MKVKIWGARGSIPAPLKPHEVREKIYQALLGATQVNLRDRLAVQSYLDKMPSLLSGTAGGNTSCVEVRAEQQLFIIDAGSGIRDLGIELMNGPCGRGEGVIHLLFSHAHWDHIQGFPFFRPAFVPGNKIFIYSVHDLEAVLTDQQKFINFPVPVEYMQAKREFIRITPEEPFKVGEVKINTIETVHPGKAYAFRFDDEYSTFVFASDAEYKNLDGPTLQPYIDFFRNADGLVFDAQFTLGEALEKVDWGHSSAMIGVDMARTAGVRKLILFHHDPTYSDKALIGIQKNAVEYQAQNLSLPTCEVVVGYEGMMLDLTPAGAVSVELDRENKTAVLTPTTIFGERGMGKLEVQLARLQELGDSSDSIIDLSLVETLDTATLKALIAKRREQNADIVLACPSPQARQVIELAGFLDFFAIYSSVEAATAALKARQELNLSGQVIKERYQIEEKLGDGHLGALLKATDLVTKQAVAVKILAASFSESSVNRMLHQAKSFIHLKHVNIVDVFDCDMENDLAFIVEEFAPGRDLQTILTEAGEPLSIPLALNTGLQIAYALGYVHSRGKIHGYLHPENIMLTPTTDTHPVSDGGSNFNHQNGYIAKVKRFGLGWFEEGINLLETPVPLLPTNYLAPEQILGHPLDARTDLYALGVILYQLFTGQLPFDGCDDTEIMNAHLHHLPSSPREQNANLSNALEHFILKLLAKNPNERYANAQQAYHILKSLAVHKGSQLDAQSPLRQQQKILVGRQEPLERLSTAWEEVSQGNGRLYIVSGEDGIGKTHLLQEWARRVHDGVVLTGYCEKWAGSLIYQPFVDIFQNYFATIPPEIINQTDKQLLSELSRLIPKLHTLVPELKPPPELEPKQEQLRIMTTVAKFLAEATKTRPWLLILEDLQWMDEGSLHMFVHLARQSPTMRLLIVGTYCNLDLDKNHPLLNTLRGLKRQPSYTVLTLERLRQSEVGQLIVNILQQTATVDVVRPNQVAQTTIPDSLVTRIYQQTEGNPVYVEEIVSGLIDNQHITETPHGWDFSKLSKIELPQTVKDAVLTRLGNLNQDTQDLLRKAAVLGRTFKFDDLQRMSGLSEWEVLERLDMALERQLIRELFDEGMLTFSHAETQQVLYADTTSLRRRTLHLQAGKAIEARFDSKSSPDVRQERAVEQLAHHYDKAGKYSQALLYYMEAARLAETTYAAQTALHWYQRVIGLLQKLQVDDIAEFRDAALTAHEAMIDLCIVLGYYDEALEHCHQANQLLNETDTQPPLQKRQIADLYRKQARIYKKQGKLDAAAEALGQAFQRLDPNETTIERVSVYLLQAEVQHHQGEVEVSNELCHKGLNIAEKLDSLAGQQGMARAYYLLSGSYLELGDLNEALEYCQKSLQAYERIQDLEGLSRVYITLAQIYIHQSTWQQAEEILNKSLTMKQEIGDTFGLGRIFINLADLQFKQGNYDQAASLLHKSLTIWRQLGTTSFEIKALTQLADLELARNNLSGAEMYIKQGEAVLSDERGSRFRVALERQRAKLCLQTNQLEAALGHIQTSIELSELQQKQFEQALNHRILAEIEYRRNNLAAAKKAIQHSLAFFSKLGNEYEIAKTTLLLAQLNRSAQDVSKAVATFERLGAKADLAHALDLQVLEVS